MEYNVKIDDKCTINFTWAPDDKKIKLFFYIKDGAETHSHREITDIETKCLLSVFKRKGAMKEENDFPILA